MARATRETETELSEHPRTIDIVAPHLPDTAHAYTRLWFIDNMRLLMIAGVVVYHVAAIYIGVGFN